MKLLEAKGVDAIEILADLLDPIAEIAKDGEILSCVQTGQKLKAVKFAMKRHAKTILEILAICEGVPVEDYHPSVLDIPAKLLEVVNTPEVESLFTSQVQTQASSFGLATESTEVEEK